MRAYILLGTSLVYLCVSNIVWIARDTRPPFWDMAYHQTAALRVYEAICQNGLSAVGDIPQLTGFYPPFYHSVIALFYGLFGKSSSSAQLANLPAIALLLFSTFAIGRRLLPPTAAAASAILVCFYPILIWLSRETIIDYWLASMVTLAMLFLLRTDSFSKRSESILFAVVCGLGMLVKWTFAFFLILPSLWAARKNWKNAALAVLIIVSISSYWYLPRWQSLVRFYSENTAGGVVEGDPSRLSWQAVVFYVRAMESYQLFLPLFVLFVAGVMYLARHYVKDWTPVLLWIIGSWCCFLLFQNKDPRYTVPLLPAVALISAAIFRSRKHWCPILLILLIFQHYLVSFGIRALPEKVTLIRGVEGPISWDWNLYSQSYFQLLGPPVREDWKIEYILAEIAPANGPAVRIGIIPSIPRFDPEAFEFYSALRKYPITVKRLWYFDEISIAEQDYILMSEGDQGHAAFFSDDLIRINQYILNHPEEFQLVDRLTLPSSVAIRLYKVMPL